MQEITTHAQLTAWIADAGRVPATILSLDLVPFAEELAGADLADSVFVGCGVPPQLAAQIAVQRGALIDRRGGLPFDPFPGSLYTVATIYAGFDPAVPGSWAQSYDHRVYDWFMDAAEQLPRPLGLADTLAARMHDSAMERTVRGFLGTTSTIAFMGGHDRLRTDPAFLKVASLARTLRRAGRMIVTGGGPGFMEAANLGAFLAGFDDTALDAAMAILVTAPSYTDTHNWLQTACAVRANLLGDWHAAEPAGSTNLGIPTWLYGHEPPNLFSSHIGKFFYNSLREDGLVTIASGGIVFAEGNAGTVQEVFQDATQNYYRKPNTAPTPMVLFNSTPGFWDLPCDKIIDPKRKKPLYPLLKQLANERASTVFDSALLLSDDVDAIANFLLGIDPNAPTKAAKLSAAHTGI